MWIIVIVIVFVFVSVMGKMVFMRPNGILFVFVFVIWFVIVFLNIVGNSVVHLHFHLHVLLLLISCQFCLVSQIGPALVRSANNLNCSCQLQMNYFLFYFWFLIDSPHRERSWRLGPVPATSVHWFAPAHIMDIYNDNDSSIYFYFSFW